MLKIFGKRVDGNLSFTNTEHEKTTRHKYRLVVMAKHWMEGRKLADRIENLLTTLLEGTMTVLGIEANTLF